MHSHTHPHESTPQTEGRLIRWASTYDLVTNILTFGQASRLRRRTIDHTLLKPGESILDVGCGTGGVTIPAKKRVGASGKAAGIDPSPEMIAVARTKASRARLEIDFRVGVIESLPFSDNSFNAVTSSLMMHHLPRDLQVRGLAEVYRVLKPGGRVLIVDMMREKKSLSGPWSIFAALHRGLEWGIEDLLDILSGVGFTKIEQLDDRFAVLGFMRATK
ncbi:MAG: methyltransferase domain-containing protein [Chloroflexota bacterium]